MRHRDYAFLAAGLLLAGLAAPPLAAQPSSPPTIIHRLPGPQPPSLAPGQMAVAPTTPTLAFDAESKRYDASPGEEVAPFTFNLTNVWTNEIIVDRVQGSCGCTKATLPFDPWHLRPGESGPVQVQVRLAGKMGLFSKTLTFYYRLAPASATLYHTVTLVVNIPPPPSTAATMTTAERAAAADKARADAQAVFRGDCARCHADKGRKALGQDLYAADCGICHESSHRDSLVPDLHALKQPTDFDYWKTVITLGKPRTMMPAFAATQGGPLTEAQIASLASYLNHTISHNLSAVMTNASNAPLIRAASLP